MSGDLSRLSNEELERGITAYEASLAGLPNFRKERHTPEQMKQYRELERELERYRSELRRRQGELYPDMPDEDIVSQIEQLGRQSMMHRPDEGSTDDDYRIYGESQRMISTLNEVARRRGITPEERREAIQKGELRGRAHQQAHYLATVIEQQGCDALSISEEMALKNDPRFREMVRGYLPGHLKNLLED